MSNQCVYVSWFQYCGKCPIKTCKYNTDKTETGCLANTLASESKKIITDAEIMYHKFDGLSLTQVSAKRKDAVLRVKRVLVLHQYLEYIRVNCKLEDVGPIMPRFLRKVFPFKVKKLGITDPILPHLFSERTYKAFKRSLQLKEDFALHDVLFLSKKQWLTLCSDIKSRRKRWTRKSTADSP